jgi:hypothetical protein
MVTIVGDAVHRAHHPERGPDARRLVVLRLSALITNESLETAVPDCKGGV